MTEIKFYPLWPEFRPEEPKPESAFKIPTLQKIGAITMISDEALFLDLIWCNPEFARKCNTIKTPPSQEQWRLYYRALKAMKILEAYEGTEWGGPDYGTEVNEPSPTYCYEYLETHEEWLARCRELVRGMP